MKYDLIIVGGGPAGVAAGIYAARKRLKTALISQDIGGQSVNSGSIENFIGIEKISGFDFAQTLEKHLRAQQDIDIFLGATVSEITSCAEGFVVRTHTGKDFETKTVLIALGSSYKRLDIPGEKQFEGKGVFYCSICDAPLMKGKEVVVIGGGNSGLEAVLDLIPYAQHVTLLNRSDVLRGDPLYQEKIAAYPHASIRMNTIVTEFRGDAFLQQIHVRDTGTGKEEDMAVSGAFVEVGYQPNTALVKDLVTLNEKGQIVVDHKTMKTSCAGIWSAGDCTDGLYHQNNTAVGDAVKAVLNIYEALR